MKLTRLYNKAAIQKRVKTLAKNLRHEYMDGTITLLCVLKGAMPFATDLARELGGNVEFLYVTASSWKGQMCATGEPEIGKLPCVRNKHILIVDDIFETGKTIGEIRALASLGQPMSVHTCALLWKAVRSAYRASPDYYGFIIPDHFVVGYGLDYKERLRNLPYIGILEP